MSIWEGYPKNYRKKEVDYVSDSISSGKSVAILGLSGSGKSNLLGFIYHIGQNQNISRFVFVDCNRIIYPTPQAFYRLLSDSVNESRQDSGDLRSAHQEFAVLEQSIKTNLPSGERLCFLLDRFEVISDLPTYREIASNLRALRDSWKYSLTYLTATRKLFDDSTELAELFYGNRIWLGPLSESDALWSARRDEQRLRKSPDPWDAGVFNKLIEISWGYPSLLRACCEAYALGNELSVEAMAADPGVIQRVHEFWKDSPTESMLEKSGLLNQPLLYSVVRVENTVPQNFDTANLTQKENQLLEHLIANEGEVCKKDDLIRAVWSEDVIFELGIRDESLAQLIRRLRKKIEADPSKPKYIRTVTGRGYMFIGANQ